MRIGLLLFFSFFLVSDMAAVSAEQGPFIYFRLHRGLAAAKQTRSRYNWISPTCRAGESRSIPAILRPLLAMAGFS